MISLRLRVISLADGAAVTVHTASSRHLSYSESHRLSDTSNLSSYTSQ